MVSFFFFKWELNVKMGGYKENNFKIDWIFFKKGLWIIYYRNDYKGFKREVFEGNEFSVGNWIFYGYGFR